MNRDLVEQFRAQLLGEVVTPEHEGYEEARRVHNGAIDKHPALVVRSRVLSDVVTAVRFARATGLKVAIRGGGHSVAGHGTCDGGMVIDLSAMHGVHVDRARGTVHVQGGALLADLDRTTQVFGMAVPAGQVSSTGVAGLALNGGMGMLQRKYGLTCDNLVSAEVVTASGDVVTASEDSHPELYWALRGAGGNFGVVTSLEFRMHEIGSMAMAGLVAYPVDRAVEVLEFLREYISTAPEEISADGIFQHAPPIAGIPAEYHGSKLIGIFLRAVGDVEAGYEAVRPLQEFGEPVLSFFGPTPYVAVQSLLDPLNPRGFLNYWTGEYVPELSRDVIEILAEYGANLPATHSVIQIIPFNGAVTQVTADATAFTHRQESWLIHALGQWGDPAETDHCTAWVKKLGAQLRTFGSGAVYLNLVTDEEETDRVQAFWQTGRLRRLARIKATYDPDNVFCFNHNIRPDVDGGGGQS